MKQRMNEPIRVLHVLGGLKAGGAESFVINLYRTIDKDKVQFDFVKHISSKGVFEDEITEKGGKIFQCPRYTGKNHFAYCKWWNNFFASHPEYRVIHGHVRSTAAIYLKIAKRHGLITIAHSHSTSNGTGVSAFAKNIMQLPIRTIAEYFFACSKKAGVWLYGKRATNKDNFYIIRNGIELSRFAFDQQKRRKMRQNLEIEETTIVLGHVGRFTVPKNHKFLLKLFAQYHKRNPDSCLLLVGDGELFETIKQQCNQLKIDNSVKLVGSRTNTEDYYQAMDIFLFPSLWEGLGIVVVEAQANGLPCLVSDNVPKDALVTNTAKVLLLDKLDDWLKALENLHPREKAEPLDQGLCDFDIATVAGWLQGFYLEQYRKTIQRKK